MIVGAGLAGLIAAHAFPQHKVVEAGPRAESHKALLRFRSDAVARLTGIDFKAVSVNKGIFFQGGFQQPSILMANMYAQKVVGRTIDRSVWNLDSVVRFIAPGDFYDRLVENLHGRVQFDCAVNLPDVVKEESVISTIPMPAALGMFGVAADKEHFQRAAINVVRYRVPNCDVYQTIYFPTHQHGLYRASITGDLLICEFTERGAGAPWELDVRDAFNVNLDDCELLEVVSQKYGKISPIDEQTRKRLVNELTDNHGIFSLGRFATWRNLLLDDVVQDAEVIKRLLVAGQYDRWLERK